MDTPNSTPENPAPTSTWWRSVLALPWRWVATFGAFLSVLLAGMLLSRRKGQLVALDRTVEQINKSHENLAKLKAKESDLVAKLVGEAAKETGIEKAVHDLPEDEVTRRLRALGYIK